MEAIKISAVNALQRLPLPPTAKWPGGVWDVEVLRHGTMSAEIFAPRERDYQSPHTQDELYIVIGGTARLLAGDTLPFPCAPGDLLFVPAGMPHHFEEISESFAAWVIFYGPPGGEPSTDSNRTNPRA